MNDLLKNMHAIIKSIELMIELIELIKVLRTDDETFAQEIKNAENSVSTILKSKSISNEQKNIEIGTIILVLCSNSMKNLDSKYEDTLSTEFDLAVKYWSRSDDCLDLYTKYLNMPDMRLICGTQDTSASDFLDVEIIEIFDKPSEINGYTLFNTMTKSIAIIAGAIVGMVVGAVIGMLVGGIPGAIYGGCSGLILGAGAVGGRASLKLKHNKPFLNEIAEGSVRPLRAC